jgi:hypothetical protein
MNPTRNDATANNPASPAVGGNGRAYPNAPPASALPSAPRPASRPRGNRSTLKYLIPVVAFVAVVFGVTFFGQYTPPSEESKPGGEGDSKDPPLRFFTSARKWDPPSFLPPSRYQPLDFRGLPLLAPSAAPQDPDFPFRFSPQDRAFPGFYEVKDDSAGLKHSTTFWFENPHQKAVTMLLRYVSCGACSGGKVAAIPPDVTRQLLEMSRVSILPQGLATGLPLGMVGPAANLDDQHLSWQSHIFRDNPGATYKVPAAGENPDGWTPQWGILKLEFSVGAVGPKKLDVYFQSAVEDSKELMEHKFILVTEGMSPFELSRDLIDLGELNDRSEPRTFEIIAFSATRGPLRTRPGEMGDLAPPLATVRMPSAQGGDPGKFVQVSAPERIPDAELSAVAELIAEMAQRQKFVRVESAYRYKVTFNPKADDRSIDIGLLEREIWFTLGGGEQRQVRVKGMVSGVVWLDDNQNEIAMPNSAQSAGFTKTFNLVTARHDLEVKLLEKETKPGILQVKLEKDPNPPAGDRGYYKLTVRVQSAKENKTIRPGTWSGEIVLEVKGAAAQRIRIPIRGRITLN